MENQLTIKFGGDGNIKVETLTEFLESYKSLFQLINNQFGHSKDDFVIEVSPPENGSFKIKLSPKYKDLILNNFGNLLTGTLAGLIVLWASNTDNPTLEEIRDILKKNQTEKVVNPQDVYNIYQNVEARTLINTSFKVISNDSRVTNFKMEQNDVEVVNIASTNFENLIRAEDENLDEEIDSEVKIIADIAELVIKTIHFEGGAKWGFIFRGYPIKASMKAPGIQQMLNNESFRRGDVLKVKLERKQSFDSDLGTFIVDQNSYEIVEIIDHTSKSNDNRQTRIDDE